MVDTRLSHRDRSRPVLMIVHAYYEEDPRVRREAESLVAAGRPVSVLGLRRTGEAATAVVDGVRVERLNVQRHQGAGLAVYLREYLGFFWRAAWAAMRAQRRESFGLVEVHSLPDFLVFAALPLRLRGVPVLLDLHEAMPEFFRSRFPRASNRLVHLLLLTQERLSIAMSAATLVVNDAMRARLLGLGVKPEKVRVVPNSPSLARFDAAAYPHRVWRADGSLRLVYAGALTPTYELDVAVRAVAVVAPARPDLDVHFDVYGRGDSDAALRALARELGIDGRVTFHGRIPIEAVPAAVAGADIGLAPTRRDRFTDFSLSTKIYEYAAMGKPVIASRLPMVTATFPPETIRTYEAGDPDDLARRILELVDDPAERESGVERTIDVVREHAWENESKRYLAIVDRLAGDATGRDGGPVTLRPATPADAALLLSWANDPATRAASFASEPIPLEGHERWLAERLADPDARLWIGETDNVAIGVVRFERRDGGRVEVSITIAPDARGRHLARPLLQAGLAAAREAFGGRRFLARVRPENDVSVALFGGAGFVPVEPDQPGQLAFERD